MDTCPPVDILTCIGEDCRRQIGEVRLRLRGQALKGSLVQAGGRADSLCTIGSCAVRG
jgi:hypothetical protein